MLSFAAIDDWFNTPSSVRLHNGLGSVSITVQLNVTRVLKMVRLFAGVFNVMFGTSVSS